jgi:hypothetical protein
VPTAAAAGRPRSVPAQAGAPSPAQATAIPPARAASDRDLERLQDDLENLDDLLEGLEPNDSQSDAFRARAQLLQEDVVYLKVKMRRHREGGGTGTGVGVEEVDRVRRGAAFLREDIERAFGGGSATKRGQSLPAGTEFMVRLGQELSSKTARMEDRFEATVDVPVHTDSGTALAHTTLRGSPQRGAGRAALEGTARPEFYAIPGHDAPTCGRVVDRPIRRRARPRRRRSARGGPVCSEPRRRHGGRHFSGRGGWSWHWGEEVVLPEGTRSGAPDQALTLMPDRAAGVREGRRPPPDVGGVIDRSKERGRAGRRFRRANIARFREGEGP